MPVTVSRCGNCQELEKAFDTIPIETYIAEGIPFKMYPSEFKKLIIRITEEGLDDKDKRLLVPFTETLENIHDLLMAGRHKDACGIYEKWFHRQIGSV